MKVSQQTHIHHNVLSHTMNAGLLCPFTSATPNSRPPLQPTFFAAKHDTPRARSPPTTTPPCTQTRASRHCIIQTCPSNDERPMLTRAHSTRNPQPTRFVRPLPLPQPQVKPSLCVIQQPPPPPPPPSTSVDLHRSKQVKHTATAYPRTTYHHHMVTEAAIAAAAAAARRKKVGERG